MIGDMMDRYLLIILGINQGIYVLALVGTYEQKGRPTYYTLPSHRLGVLKGNCKKVGIDVSLILLFIG